MCCTSKKTRVRGKQGKSNAKTTECSRTDADGVADAVEFFRPAPDRVPAYFPTESGPYGVMWFPADVTEKAGNSPNPIPVCMDHQRGRCIGACGRLHVQRPYMDGVMQRLRSLPFSNCCLLHGDLPSHRLEFEALRQHPFLEVVGDLDAPPRIFLCPDLLAATAYWIPRNLSRTNTVEFPQRRVCRLHQLGRCNRGVECSNVHVCRQFWALRDRLRSASHPPEAYLISYVDVPRLSVQSGSLAAFREALTQG